MARAAVKSAVVKPKVVSPEDEFAAYCAELLRPLGQCKVRKMFGGHGISLDGISIALIAWEQLWLKVDEETKPKFREAGCKPFVYDGKSKPIEMSYWTAPADAMESPALMLPWARLAFAAAKRAGMKKAVKKSARSSAVAKASASGTKSAKRKTKEA
jgi:DNA transformation protein and related proteins